MDFVIAIVSSIVAKAAEYTISPIINHVKYLSNHQQNVEILKHQAEKLKVARDRVQHSVDAALRNGKEIQGDVDKWLSAVDTRILEQVEKVTQDEEKAKKKCFVGLCPHFWTRYKLSLKAAEEVKAVAELLEQGKFDEVSYPVPLQGIAITPFKGYEDFESRTLVLNGIMEALNDDSVSVIGVHGMGGIGKTMLVKEIARKVKGNLFDSVVIATVTQAIDIEKIQDRIAELLGLKFEEQSTDVKALRLRERLKKEKRVLVVLDDIWAKVDIEEVGIPVGDEHKGCKLLLTSRELNVLSNGMDAQKHFSVGFLNKNEAWDLFKKKAGDCVESCDLKPAAMEVAKKCAGLPIAIATVAGALRNKRLFEWKNALRELERPSSSNFTGIAAAYSAIEWSFNYLESEEVKLTFLLCCVIGHNGLVEKLMRYTVGLGLFGGVNTMEEARNEVLTVVANLKASSLLLDSYDDEHFDIHDVVWDAALAIASRDYHMLVLRDHIPKEWSDKAKMNSLRVISLPCPQIVAELPKEMEYSGLSFFHMAHDDSVAIPPHFFRRIESLKILDLRSYSYLPESINHLLDLRMLCLRGCLVEDITIIGELKNLEILDLAFSRIKELPKEIAQLTRLRLLDLSGCRKLKIIPPNVLSSLSKLEELYMEGSFAEWENEGVVDNKRRNASLDELNNLSRLTTLYVRISDIQMIPKHRFIETLNRYRIIVGNHPRSKWLRRHECSRTLELQLYTNICLDNGVKMLLGKAEDLYLDLEGLEGIKNVLAELNKGNDFPHLQSLHVQNGMQVQYITMNKIEFSELRFIKLERLPQLISFCCQEERCSTSFEPLPLFIYQTYHRSSNLRRLIISGCGKLEHLLSPSVARSLVAIPSLERMKISGLINAKMIFHNELPPDSFQNLRELSVSNCERLKNIFPALIAKHLPQLEQLWIIRCGVEEIVSEGEGVEEQPVSFEFPKVSSLMVEHLEKLKCFYKGQHTIAWPMLKKLTTDCSALLMIVGLEDVRIQERKGNGEAVLLVEEVIPNLETLELRNFSDMNQCPLDLFPRVGGGFHSGSSYIFPLFRRFYNLESLKFSYFDFKHVVPCKGDVGTLSPIKNLELRSSKNLKHVWRKDSELGHILSNLQTLTIWYCDDLKNIGASSLSFQNLTTLEVSNCKMMTNLVTPLVVENLVQLTTMRVRGCTEMTEIVTNEGDYHQTIVVRKLKCLEISYLQRLTSFCPGSYTFNFPCLEEVVVERCPRLKIFSEGALSTPQLQRVNQERYNRNVCWKGNLNTAIHQLYTKKGGFNIPFDLNISDTFPKLIEIWKRNPQEILESKNLSRMEIYKCSSLNYIFTPSMLLSLKQLRRIEVKECNAMEQVIREDEEEATIHNLIFPKLSFVKIEMCSNLTNFYLGSRPLEIPNLWDITIAECAKMRAFSSTISRKSEKVIDEQDVEDDTAALFCDKVVIPRLMNLKLSSINIHKIWHHPSYSPERNQMFPTLQSLCLEDPPKLKDTCFENGFEFPYLRDLTLTNCPLLRTIISKSVCGDETQIHQPTQTNNSAVLNQKVIECPKAQIFGEVEIPNQQPLFCVNEDTFPVLQELTLKTNDMIKGICDGQLSLQCFPNLKLLNLQFFPETSTTLPYSFIQSLPKLEKLVINNASISEIVRFEGLINEERHTWACYQLEALRLSQLPELTLKTLEPFLLSVKNLLSMEVSRCHGFINLMACSTAKSLTLLERLSIADSELIEEIISCEGEDLQASIVFPKLKYLQLSHLPSIASFSLAHHSLEFPVLQMVIVTDCPKMKNFSQGELSTPRLEQMHLTRDEDGELQWEGDLNTTIKHMFDQMNVQNSQAVEVTDQLLQMK
ncbi:hypothetical protein GOBAR_DD21516 [Gossypium barbadense]|nr:hypothetical protein GOBAR_DD21516 [Gossypium barbadense]